MTLSDLQNECDDGAASFDISNDIFAQARQKLIFLFSSSHLLINIYLDFYQQIYPKHHHVVNKNQILLQLSLPINSMHNQEGKTNRSSIDHYRFFSFRALYISGVPGVGKTAIVNKVVRELMLLSTDSDLPQFKYIFLNGMKLNKPEKIYNQLLQVNPLFSYLLNIKSIERRLILMN
jgi:Cdc6-like AAA superfamily ATPase